MNVVAGIRKEREREEFEVLTLLFSSSFSSLYCTVHTQKMSCLIPNSNLNLLFDLIPFVLFMIDSIRKWVVCCVDVVLLLEK